MATYLLTWNPDKWHWADLVEHTERVRRTGKQKDRWSTGNTERIVKGDRLFLLRQGVEPRGVMAAGYATGSVEELPHYDADRAAKGERANYVPMFWDSLINPDVHPILTLDRLSNGNLANIHWATPASGIEIPQPAATELDELWRRHVRSIQRPVFEVEHTYTRPGICKLLGVPKSESGGDWNTGYHEHNGEWFVFATVGAPGRTGHDYDNRWIGNELVWRGKTRSSKRSPQIQAMTSPGAIVHVFTRESDRLPFTYEGLASPKEVKDTVPVTVIWQFVEPHTQRVETLAEEIPTSARFFEGTTREVRVNVYERNPAARRACIAHYGVACLVCEIDFGETYGPIGQDFIHVHHLRELASIGAEYEVDPIADLRPVCPNCHAMLHRTDPPMPIENLKRVLKENTQD